MTLWEAAITSLLKHEGGWVHHESDPGGETNWGISKRSYPHLDIKNLTREQAVAIFERDYWSQVPENLPDDVRWFAFDICVHSGPARMRAWLNEDQTLLGLAAIRLKFLAGLSTWPTFGRGWARRVAGVLDDIRAWQQQPTADVGTRAARTVTLSGFPLALRWATLVRSPATLRGSFVWRARGDELEVRVVRE